MAHPSLPETVHLWLRSAILDGRYQPGEMLRQEDLAARLGVSRVPLREALQRLEGEGLVVLQPRRGYAVVSLDLDEIVEIFRVRTFLEGRAGFLATENRTEESVAQVKSLNDQMRTIALEGSEEIARWSTLNVEFHEALLSCGKHRHVQRLTSNLRAVVEPYIRMEVDMTGGLDEAQEEHDRLVEAYERGESQVVAKMSREHCEHTAVRLLKGLRKRKKAA